MMTQKATVLFYKKIKDIQINGIANLLPLYKMEFDAKLARVKALFENKSKWSLFRDYLLKMNF